MHLPLIIFHFNYKQQTTMADNNKDNEKPKQKTKEELEAEQQAAKEQLNAILDQTR